MPKKRYTKSSANGKNSQPRTKKMKVNDTVFDKPEEETIRADFSRQLEGALKCISIWLEGEDLMNMFGTSIRNGTLFHGKPGVGLQARKYMERHANGVSNVFTRDVATLTRKICEDTFKRATCCAPCIVLLIGLEDADPDMATVIARRMKEVADSCYLVLVLGTTAMYGQVSEKLKGPFAVVDLEELADSAPQN